MSTTRSRRTRWLVVFAISLILVMSLMPAVSAQDPITLRFWIASDPRSAQAAVDEWNASRSDVRVEFVPYPNNPEGNAQVDTALLASGQVDVLVTYGLGLFKRRADAGLILSLSELLPDFDVEQEFGESAATMMTWDDNIWGIPAQSQPYVLFVNKDAFDEAGIEIPEAWSWEEFIEIAHELTLDQGLETRYALLLPTWPYAREFVYYLNGADYETNENCTTNYDDPIFASMLDLRYRLESVEQVAVPYADIQAGRLQLGNEFYAGRTATMLGGTWLLANTANLPDFPRDFVTAFAPIPHPEGTEYPYRTGGLDDFTGVAANSANPEAAAEFLQWFVTDGYLNLTRLGRISSWLGFTPEEQAEAYLTSFEDPSEVIDVESLMRVVLDTSKEFPIQTRTLGAAELAQLYDEESVKVFLGEQDGTTAAVTLKQRGDTILAGLCN